MPKIKGHMLTSAFYSRSVLATQSYSLAFCWKSRPQTRSFYCYHCLPSNQCATSCRRLLANEMRLPVLIRMARKFKRLFVQSIDNLHDFFDKDSFLASFDKERHHIPVFDDSDKECVSSRISFDSGLNNDAIWIASRCS